LLFFDAQLQIGGNGVSSALAGSSMRTLAMMASRLRQLLEFEVVARRVS
jgi:hypothetical protein